MQNTRKDGVALTKEENKYAPNFNELLRKSKGPRKAANAYLEWCEMNGYTPKFDAFASHPNYYKLLEDFTTMVDEVYMPQEAVTFTFPTEESAFGSLESLIEQGLEEDALLEGQRDEKVSQIVDELQGVKYSLQTDLVDILNANNSAQDIAVAVEDLIKRHPSSGVIENILGEYRNGQLDGEDFINVLNGVANIPPRKVQKDYSEEKQTIEETFGGIWIEDRAEFANFVSAVNTYPKDRNGEGIAFTDNFFYAYYLNTSNDAIPYAEVDLNGIDSQKYVDKIIKYGQNRTAREWANWFNENIRNDQYKNNGINIGNQTTSTARADGRVDSKLPRLGRYYYTPELYSKVKRTDSGSTATNRQKTQRFASGHFEENPRDEQRGNGSITDTSYSLPSIPFYDEQGNVIDMSSVSVKMELAMLDDMGDEALTLSSAMVRSV